MRKILLTLLLAVFIMTPDYLEAATVKAPFSVKISPNMGEIAAREKVRLQNIGPDLYAFKIYLPASVSVRAGFSVEVPGFTLNSVSRKLLLPEDDPANSARGAMLAGLRAAKLEKSRLDGLERALNTRLSLWQNQSSALANLNIMPQAADIEQLDKALSAKLPEICAQLAELPEQKQKNDELTRYLQNELDAMGGERPQLAEITITVTGRAQAEEVNAEYSYISFSCGWRPSYSFEASPQTGTVLFKQRANIYQNFGQDWNEVELVLSTKALDFKTRPDELHQWNLYRREDPLKASAARGVMYASESAPMPMQAEEMMLNDRSQKTVMPVSMELSTHREWSVGRVNLSASRPSAIELEQKQWTGDFFYTLRPSLEESSYLTALVTLEKAVELPQGEAVFIVDKRLAGYAPEFMASSNELYLYFGKDDMISAEIRDLMNMKGEERFIVKTNTYNWQWEITAKNMRGRAVKVRVEDPQPQARDSSIKLTMESTPMPKEKENYYYWESEIPSGGKFVINHKIEARASGSEEIIPGR